MNLDQVTLPALDIGAAAMFFRGMGFTRIVDPPHYARFECPHGDATFSVHRVDAVVPDSGEVLYFEREDPDARVDMLQSRGFEFDGPPTDESWHWREARLKDPSGNVPCLFHAGENRKNPPCRVKA